METPNILPEEAESAQVTEASNESEVMLKILRKIVKRWWVFLIIGLVGGLSGYLHAARQRPIYESYLTFALDEGGSEGGMSGAMGLVAQFGISLGGAKDVFTGDNILEIMLSRRVIEKALLSVDTIDNKPTTLIEFYLLNEIYTSGKNNGTAQIHFYPGEPRQSFSYAKDSLLYKVFNLFKKRYVSVRRPDKKLNIYELKVNSSNEKYAKLFTDKLIIETNLFYTEISVKKTKSTLEILEKRVPDMKGKLDATITDKAAIQDANLNPAFASAQVPLLKAQSNSQVFGAAYAEMYKNMEMARFQYLKSIPLMQIIDEANYPMKKITQGKLKTAVIFSVIAGFIMLIIFTTINLISDKVAKKR